MSQVVPFTSDSAQTFSITLNGISYDFYARYVDRVGAWYFDLTRTSDQAPLARGVPILCGLDLLQPYRLGIGSMYAVDMAAYKTPSTVDGPADALNVTDAGSDDLGTRVIVLYLMPGEVLT